MDQRKAILDLELAAARLPVGDLVKSANIDELLGTEEPAASFADPVEGQYPYHTPAATLASCARLKIASTSGPVNRLAMLTHMLKARAEAFGLGKEAEAIFNPPLEKEASHPEDSDLPGNATEAEYALNQIGDWPRDFSLAHKQKIAQHILQTYPDVAKNNKAIKIEVLQKWAGVGHYHIAPVADSLLARAELHKAAGRIDAARTHAELGIALLEHKPDRVKMAEVAVLVDQMDREHNMHGHEGVLPAEEFCFVSLNELKEASKALVESPYGTAYNKADMALLSRDQLIDVFGEKQATDLCRAGIWPDSEKIASAIEKAGADEEQLWKQLLPVV